MDLSVSPDISAHICYSLVLLLGVLVAVAQVRKRLGGMDGAWLVPGTWLLFIAYIAVPLALFWLLDRTGAIADTSLFAAILIGVGYERIITGGNQTIRAPGDVSAVWTPFVAYADKVSKVVLDRGAQNQLRLAEKLVSEIMADDSRYSAIEALALARSPDTAAVRAALAEIDQAQGGGDADKQERKTRYLYGLLLSVPDIHYLLKNKNVISSRFYWTEIRRLPHGVAVSIVLILGAFGLYHLFAIYYPEDHELVASYHIWRLGKPNSTSIDQYRSRRQLVTLMKDQATVQVRATDQLIHFVQRPGLPMERIDLILQTLLESRSRRTDRDLPLKLVQALRTGSLDARGRVHDVLVFLSSACVIQADATMKDWKPTERDSSTILEDKLDQWNRYWSDVCATK